MSRREVNRYCNGKYKKELENRRLRWEMNLLLEGLEFIERRTKA
jgi:hypothetical protein